MNEIKRTSAIVKEILQEMPETRNSDDQLYFEVCRRINKNIANLPFWNVILMRKSLNIPGFETVRRTRQKIQASFPDLAGTENVEAFRAVREEEFRDYARGVNA